LEDGVSFDTGSPDKNEVKLTDGTTWTSKVSQGESDISFQVSSVHATINELLMEKKTAAAISTAVQIGDFEYTGQGYALAPKKINGALVMISSDGLTGVYLPDVEMFASFNGQGGDDSTGYYNVAVTPLTDANGAAFYILNGTAVSS
jgi:glutamine cyclotransferase